MTSAGFVFAQMNLSCTSVGLTGPKDAVGVTAMTKVWNPFVSIGTGVFGLPERWFTIGLVGW